MDINETEQFTNLLMPRFFKFAYGLVPDGKIARELIADAYSVFIVKELEFVKGTKLPKQRKAQSMIKRFFLMGILSEIYNLSQKKSFNIRGVIHQSRVEYKAFYSLSLHQRAVLILKERLNFTPEAIGQVMGIKKYQVIESLYNSREQLNGVDYTTGDDNVRH